MPASKRKLSGKDSHVSKQESTKKLKTKNSSVHKAVTKAAKKADPDDHLTPNASESDFEGFDAKAASDDLVGSDKTGEEYEDGAVPEKSNGPATKRTKKDHAAKAESTPKKQKSQKSEMASDQPTRVTDGTSSKELHAKQKTLMQQRKAAKPNAANVQRSKKLWERLRLKSHVPREERKKLVEELFEIMTGHVKDFVFKHDAVRVVQTAIKYANREQRRMIAKELRGNFLALAEGRYSKFLIGKLVVHGDKEVRDLIIPEFFGHVRHMMRHAEASWLLDDIYRGVASPKQKDRLLREWYGGDFAVLANTDPVDETSKLANILARTPEKRLPIMRALYEFINRMVQKRTTGFTMLHDAMWEYFSNVKRGSDEMTEFLEMLKGDEEGDLLKNLAFTPSGSRVVCLALALGTAKDRKLLMRPYKDIIQLLAYDANGHTVLLTLFEVVDDTVLTGKYVLAGLVGQGDQGQEDKVLAAATHPVARIALLYLPAGRAKSLLRPGHAELFKEIDEARAETSKKDPGVRRTQLLKVLSPSLLKTVEDHAGSLCQDDLGCQFISHVLLGCIGDKTKALESVADQAAGDPNNEGHLASSVSAARMLKVLVQGGQFKAETGKVEEIDPPLRFHDLLYERIRPHLMDWATGRGSFVVVALLEASGFSSHQQVLLSLKKHRQDLESVAGNGAMTTGKGHVKKDVDDVDDGVGEGKGTKHKEGGNQGARVLLEKLH